MHVQIVSAAQRLGMETLVCKFLPLEFLGVQHRTVYCLQIIICISSGDIKV